MKLATAVICTKCDEVFDIHLYRVCPACANTESVKVTDKVSPPVVDTQEM